MTDLTRIGAAAKEAAFALANASTAQKNAALMAIAAALEAHAEDILRANREDVEAARANGMSPSMLDRLSLSEARVKGMAEGVREVAALADPVGSRTFRLHACLRAGDGEDRRAAGRDRHHLRGPA